MLVKLLPDQITKYWNSIKVAVQGTVPEGMEYNEEKLSNVLENLLADTMQCWWIVRENGEQYDVHAIIVTAIFSDNVRRSNILRISHLYGLQTLEWQMWLDSQITLVKFAKSRGCTAIDAFTAHEGIVDQSVRLGAKHLSYIIYEIGDNVNG